MSTLRRSSTVSLPRVVLVVDDDPDARQLIVALLRHHGFTVDEAGDGRAALERARARRPDVIILDLDMPVMDGRAFLAARKVDEVLRAVPVVVFTASADVADVRATADAVVQKPADLDDLLAVIRSFAKTVDADAAATGA